MKKYIIGTLSGFASLGFFACFQFVEAKCDHGEFCVKKFGGYYCMDGTHKISGPYDKDCKHHIDNHIDKIENTDIFFPYPSYE